MNEETERLERIIVSQQVMMKALETKIDRMAEERAERGEVNARLNKENGRLQKQLEGAYQRGYDDGWVEGHNYED